MAVASSWEDLKSRFLEKLSLRTSNQPGDWLDIWRLFVAHPWYLAQLDVCARRVLIDGSPLEWLEDLKQDAILLLARDLLRSPDLGLDLVRAEAHFPGWMQAVIRQDCLEVLRRLRRLHGRKAGLGDRDLVIDERELLDLRVDLGLAMDQLDEPDRAVLALYAKGFNRLEISTHLGLSYSQTRCTLSLQRRTARCQTSGRTLRR